MRLGAALALLALGCSHRATPPSRPQPAAARPPARDTAAAAPTRRVAVESSVDSAPTIVYCPPPDYPASLRGSGVQGQVRVEMVVDTLGRPELPTVRAMGSPNPELARAAVNAMLSCLFTPARVGAQAVRAVVQIPVDFTPER